MKSLYIFCASLLVFLAGPANSDGFITGEISFTDSGSSNVLPEADIWIFDATTAELVTETQTDEFGSFESDPLAEGNYKIRVKGLILKDDKCALSIEEFLGTPDGKEIDVFDGATEFTVIDGVTTRIVGSARSRACQDPILCILRSAGITGVVVDDEEVPLDGILVRAKNAINAMPVWELETGSENFQSGVFSWERKVCVFPDLKVRFVDPTGQFVPEYFEDQPDDFSLATILDLVPPLDEKVIVSLSRRSLPEQVAFELEELLPTGNTKDDQRIEKALEHIYEALNPEYWDGVDRITDDEVFDELKNAVKELEKLDDVDSSEFIDALVAAAARIADTAIEDAQLAGGDQKDIDKALKEMGKAELKAEDGKYSNAIEHYEKAWEHAEKAV